MIDNFKFNFTKAILHPILIIIYNQSSIRSFEKRVFNSDKKRIDNNKITFLSIFSMSR